MSRLLICVLLLASLAACAAPSGPGAFRCSKHEKICVKLTATEPIITGQPVSVTITVTSERDIPGLIVYLSTYPAGKVSIEEEPGQPSPKSGGLKWTMDVKANQEIIFTRKINLPSVEREYGGYAYIDLIAFVQTAVGMVVDDELTIYVTPKGGKVYYAGTLIPTTSPGPALTVTPGPSPTFIPTPTTYPYPNP